MAVYYFKCSEVLYAESEYVRVSLDFKQNKGYYICAEAVHIDTEFCFNFSKTFSSDYFNNYYDGNYVVVDCNRRSKKRLAEAQELFSQKAYEIAEQWLINVNALTKRNLFFTDCIQR